MTVITAMKFSSQSAGMVADAQSSNGNRKYNYAKKVLKIEHPHRIAALIGGAGSANVFNELIAEVKRRAAESERLTSRELAEIVSEASCRLKRELIEKALQTNYGISSNEVITGVRAGEGQIHSTLLEEMKKYLTGQTPQLESLINTWFIMVSHDSEGIELQTIGMGYKPLKSAAEYAVIGSGSDEADRKLYEFLMSRRRDERTSIDFTDGMSALIRATNSAAEFNQGVGGIPTIAYVKAGEIITVGEKESLLASEVVRVRDAKLINSKRAREGIKSLLMQDSSYTNVEAEIFGKSNNYDRIMRLLRGYRI